MSKIFEFNGSRNGSYIDPISGVVGVNTNGEWAQTEKGLAWRGNGDDTYINTNRTQDQLMAGKNKLCVEAW
jgi:hypothetical protein